MQRPMAYKGTSHSWLRNLGKIEAQESWTGEPALPDGPDPEKNILGNWIFPACLKEQPTLDLKLKVKLGFSQLTCQSCRDIRSTAEWLYKCRIQWHKCGEHVHRATLQKIRGFDPPYHVNTAVPRGRKRKRLAGGIDRPMPKKRGIEGFDGYAIDGDDQQCQ